MYWLPAILVLPYFFLFINFCRKLIHLKQFHVSSDPVTFVSVVVACRDEEKNLNSLLGSISGQDYPGNLFEVIVVNDNSKDRTFEIAESFAGINKLSEQELKLQKVTS